MVQRCWYQEGIDLEEVRSAAGAMEGELEEESEAESEEQRDRRKWGPRQEIDMDGATLQLITIGTDPSGPLASSIGCNFTNFLCACFGTMEAG